MSTNGRYFVPPPEGEHTFNDLFKKMMTLGAGRPLDELGVPVSWTPDSLCDEISQLDPNGRGVDLRTVQRWFSDQAIGISAANIRLLAYLFACRDRKFVSDWQIKLSNSVEVQKKLKSCGERPSVRTSKDLDINTGGSHTRQVSTGNSKIKLSDKILNCLVDENYYNVIFTYFIIYSVLIFYNYAVGTLSVTYSPIQGLEKQVGFIWAPSLTILPCIVLPMFIHCLGGLTSNWVKVARVKITFDAYDENLSSSAFKEKLSKFEFSYWLIALFSVGFVFAYQWIGIYVSAYLTGDSNGVLIDRYLINLHRPDYISVLQSLFLSATGYLYTASYIFVFLIGLLLCLIICLDYCDLIEQSLIHNPNHISHSSALEGLGILFSSLKISILGIWIGTLIKLQYTYLSSDASNFIAWLKVELFFILSISDLQNGWLKTSSIIDTTTILMCTVSLAMFAIVGSNISQILRKISIAGSKSLNPPVKLSLGILLILFINVVLIGRVKYFLLILALAIFATVYAFAKFKISRYEDSHGTG